MKQILQKQNIIIGIILAGFFSFGIMLQSCQMEDESLELDKDIEYSEYLNVFVDNNIKAFTEDEIKTITEAFMRIDKYLLEKKDISFILKNKQDVRTKLNISENLFEYLLLGINTDNSIRSTQMRLRSEVESQSGPGYYMRSVNLSHSETIALMNGMQTASSHAGFWGGTLAGIIGGTAAGILVGGKFYLEGLSWSNIFTREPRWLRIY